jgi:transposase-like protein
MAWKRRVFGAAFKALVAAKGDQTTAQLASRFGAHTSQVTAWKKQLMAQVTELFADGQPPLPRLLLELVGQIDARICPQSQCRLLRECGQVFEVKAALVVR